MPEPICPMPTTATRSGIRSSEIPASFLAHDHPLPRLRHPGRLGGGLLVAVRERYWPFAPAGVQRVHLRELRDLVDVADGVQRLQPVEEGGNLLAWEAVRGAVAEFLPQLILGHGVVATAPDEVIDPP